MRETARLTREEGEDDVKSAWPLCPGLHTCYNGRYKLSSEAQDGANLLKAFSVRIEGLQLDLHEAGIASNRKSATLR
jgi:hypothetical protein